MAQKCIFWQKNDIFSAEIFVELEKSCNFACKSLDFPM
jgi:hypothetical protein